MSSSIDSMVFAPRSAYEADQAQVVLATVGSGKLGYIGDVNNETESQRVVLAMCGLL
jgi:hypothetical protein